MSRVLSLLEKRVRIASALQYDAFFFFSFFAPSRNRFLITRLTSLSRKFCLFVLPSPPFFKVSCQIASKCLPLTCRYTPLPQFKLIDTPLIQDVSLENTELWLVRIQDGQVSSSFCKRKHAHAARCN